MFETLIYSQENKRRNSCTNSVNFPSPSPKTHMKYTKINAGYTKIKVEHDDFMLLQAEIEINEIGTNDCKLSHLK